jgi:thymidylate synthase (FAD)
MNKDLEEYKGEINETSRAVSQELEEVLYKPFKVLDHGFIRVIDYMGNDSAIVQAARVSYGVGTKKLNQDKGLIQYLIRHRHTTPLEMCEIKFHIKLPIFIARQWIRHRTANVNEYSARYSILGKDFYVPDHDQCAVQSKTNMQGRGDILSKSEAEKVRKLLIEDAERCYVNYQDLLNEDMDGNTIDENKPRLTRELARMNLTLNYYTEWYWKIDLHNLLHFLSLRGDSHAQYEIRVYAQVMLELVKKWVPFVYEAFEEYYLHGSHVSRKGLQVVKDLIAGKEVNQESSGMTKREWSELMNMLDKK